MTNQDRIYGLSGKCSSCEFCDDYEQEHAYGSTFVIERWRDCGNGYARKVMDAMFNNYCKLRNLKNY